MSHKSAHALKHMLQLIQHRDWLPLYLIILFTENLPNSKSKAEHPQNHIFVSKPSQDSPYAVCSLNDVYLCDCSG